MHGLCTVYAKTLLLVVAGCRAVCLKLVDHRSGHMSDSHVLLSGCHFIVCFDCYEFDDERPTRREIQELEDSGKLNGSRRNVFGLFQLDDQFLNPISLTVCQLMT
jgi:hypothetical protein